MELGSYEGIVLHKSGMCMEMVGPGDRIRLSEICRNIVIENNTNSDTNRDAVSKIYETFLYSTITDVSVMQQATLDHYMVVEPDGLEQLRWMVYTERPCYQGHSMAWEAQQCCTMSVDTWLRAPRGC